MIAVSSSIQGAKSAAMRDGASASNGYGGPDADSYRNTFKKRIDHYKSNNGNTSSVEISVDILSAMNGSSKDSDGNDRSMIDDADNDGSTSKMNFTNTNDEDDPSTASRTPSRGSAIKYANPLPMIATSRPPSPVPRPKTLGAEAAPPKAPANVYPCSQPFSPNCLTRMPPVGYTTKVDPPSPAPASGSMGTVGEKDDLKSGNDGDASGFRSFELREGEEVEASSIIPSSITGDGSRQIVRWRLEHLLSTVDDGKGKVIGGGSFGEMVRLYRM